MKKGLILGSALADALNCRSLGWTASPKGVISLTFPSGVPDSQSDGPVGSLHHCTTVDPTLLLGGVQGVVQDGGLASDS